MSGVTLVWGLAVLVTHALREPRDLAGAISGVTLVVARRV